MLDEHLEEGSELPREQGYNAEGSTSRNVYNMRKGYWIRFLEKEGTQDVVRGAWDACLPCENRVGMDLPRHA